MFSSEFFISLRYFNQQDSKSKDMCRHLIIEADTEPKVVTEILCLGD